MRKEGKNGQKIQRNKAKKGGRSDQGGKGKEYYHGIDTAKCGSTSGMDLNRATVVSKPIKIWDGK